DIYDGEIGKRLVFERNNRIILIYFTYFFEGPKPGDFSGPDRDVREEDLKNISVLMREIYLSYRQKIIKQKKEFGLGPYDSFYYYLEQDFRKGKLKNVLPEEVQKLIIDFDTIINSLELK
ncbi:MAG TPA: hypothetical protein PLV76_02325, partial [Spirochaetales bacterium]|nr:hypothetical protein [Spirochaetales bacterium]